MVTNVSQGSEYASVSSQQLFKNFLSFQARRRSPNTSMIKILENSQGDTRDGIHF